MLACSVYTSKATNSLPGKTTRSKTRRARQLSICRVAQEKRCEWLNTVGGFAAAALLGITVGVQGAVADPNSVRLPPINENDPYRCDRAFTGNTIGQANAVSNELLDFRGCSYENEDLTAKTLSGAIMLEVNFKSAKMSEVIMSKAYAVAANFEGADFSNAVVDRVDFSKANLKDTNFFNAIITGSSFDGADLTGADFTDALVGSEDVKRMCKNPTVLKYTRLSLGCKD